MTAREFYSLGSNGDLGLKQMIAPMSQEQLFSQCEALQGHTVYVVMKRATASAASAEVSRVGVLSNESVDGKWNIEFPVSMNALAKHLSCETMTATVIEEMPLQDVEYVTILSAPLYSRALSRISSLFYFVFLAMCEGQTACGAKYAPPSTNAKRITNIK